MTWTQDIFKVAVASRPLSWIFGPILFGIGLIHSRRVPRTPSALILAALQVFSLSIPLCIIVFGINDLYDFSTDKRNPRKIESNLQGGVVGPEHHSLVRTSAYLSTLIVMGVSLLTRRPWNILATFFLLFFGWQYSALPLRLKEVPVFDSLSNGLIVFFAWFCGFSFSGHGLLDIPSKSLVLALCTSSIHALAAVVDVDADVAVGQRTIAAVFGQRVTVIFSAVCFFLAAITEDPNSIWGGYLWVGSLLMLVPCLNISLARRTFESIVYLSIISVVIWLYVRVRGMARVA